jgi:exoribonuclease II
MFLLFEEDGAFKVGTLFSETDATVQVETPTGKRIKIKRTALLLQFTEPPRDALLPSAQAIADSLDVQFLWECAPQEEFGVHDFAREVFSEKPLSQEVAGLLLALHQAPMYFYRKGKGRFRAAPEESLKAAKAGAERKRLAAQAQAMLHSELVQGNLPQEIRQAAISLLAAPDKQSIAFKALESAAFELRTTPARLLLDRGALPSVYSLLRARFLQQCFPAGTGFSVSAQELNQVIAAAEKHTLPQAEQPAYSIDDVTTTEIDDAFSLMPLASGGWRVGIHIAAPALGIDPAGAVGQMALNRASTVYFPGDKITMLPPALIEAFSLDEGKTQTALSLYVDFNEQGERLASQSRAERVRIEKNLRLGDWEQELDQPLELIREQRLPWPGLKTLLFLAFKLREGREAVRGKPEPRGRVDFNFYVDWNEANPNALETGDGIARIVERRRGSPIDVLVSEFMILANTTWGDRLALARLPGIYRVQTMGRVRMQTTPGPHQGLGVNNYAWSTSPLRRYSDLLNQWQMLAVLGLRSAVFKGNEAELFSTVTHFDTLYNHYAEFQDTVERYWSQRWLGLAHGLGNHEFWSASAHGVTVREKAVALREGAFRLRRTPCLVRCLDAPQLVPGVEVELELLASDSLDLRLEAKFVGVLSAAPLDEEESIEVLSQHYAVLGDPIAHSKSPFIHAAFAQQTGEKIFYEARQVPAPELAAVLEQLIEQGYGGVNLTVPLKEEAFALARSLGWELSGRAQAAGAVNTLRFDAGGLVFADNTDGQGLVADLQRLLGGVGALQGVSILILGAGGAAQGVIGPLRQAGASHIRLANRTFEKAQQVVERWLDTDASSGEWLSAIPLSVLGAATQPRGDESSGERGDSLRADLIINASSASLAGATIEIHPHWLAHAKLAYDMMYAAKPTPFMDQARAAGVPLLADGLGMLVEQAAEAFFLWRAVRPETASVLNDLRLKLAAT